MKYDDMNKGKELTPEQLDEIHHEAMGRYQASFDAEQDQRDECLNDLRFCWVPGSQWEDSANNARRDRPRMEVNKVKLPVSQVVGEQQQNRVSIKIRPTGHGADDNKAELLNGLTRAIQNASAFNNTKDQAFKEQATCGLGGWCVTTRYEDEGFAQEIVIKPITSAASSVYYDPSAKSLMKEDAMWFMVTQDVDKASFKKKYPNATISDLTTNSTTSVAGWQDRDTVRIADYWVKEPYMKKLALMSDGQVFELTKETQSVIDELALLGITVVDTREKECHKVKLYKVSATEILEGPYDWAGKYIPVILTFGYSVWIDGQHFYQGMVRSAIDSQRIYNYSVSAMIETVALSPKDPYWVTKAQVKGLEQQFANFNNSNTPFMVYNPDDKAPGAPLRTGAPSVQTALIQQVQQADMDIQSTTGLFSPSLGNEQNDQSGRAILALQEKGSLGTFELKDNLTKAVEYTAKILIDLIPKIYDTERSVTILGLDGTAESTEINKTIIDRQTNKEVVLNDLSRGTYSVEASTGPSFETKRTETINVLTRLGESNPALTPLVTDLITELLDNEVSEELTKRVRKMMLTQGLITPNKEEQEALDATQQVDPLKELALERAVLQNELISAQILDVQAATRKQDSNVAQDESDQLKTLTEAQKDVSSSIKNKVDASKTLDDMGIQANIPLEGEIETSEAISDAIDSLTR